MSVTVRKALGIGIWAKCKLIAGETGLDNLITNVDTMEIPNITPWLRADILLCTTGYSIRDNPAQLTKLIEGLAEAGSAGIAIKTRYIGAIPSKAVEAANRLNIPLITIPDDVPFIDLVNPLIQCIGDIQSNKMRLSFDLHNRFLELELSAGSLTDIAKTLVELIKCPVLLTDETGKILVSFPKVLPPEYTDNPAVVHENGKVLRSLFPENGKLVKDTMVAQQDAEMRIYVRGALKRKRVCGYIIALDTQQIINEMSLVAIDHAAGAMSLELLRLEAVRERSAQKDSFLFLDLLSGISAADSLYRAQLLHWPQPPFAMVIFDINDFSEYSASHTEDEIQSAKETVHHMINAEFLKDHYSFKSVTIEDSFIYLIFVSHKVPAFYTLLQRILEQAKVKGFPVSIAVSAIGENFVRIKTNYTDALDALRIGRNRDPNGCISDIDQLRFDQALMHGCNNDAFRKCIDQSLGVIADYDAENGSNLLSTVRILCKNLGCRTKTAAELYLHRNTLLYRIKKIEDLTGASLADPQTIFQLSVLLSVNDYIGNPIAKR